jgi:hypothetical protein
LKWYLLENVLVVPRYGNVLTILMEGVAAMDNTLSGALDGYQLRRRTGLDLPCVDALAREPLVVLPRPDPPPWRRT